MPSKYEIAVNQAITETLKNLANDTISDLVLETEIIKSEIRRLTGRTSDHE